jgi:NAD(P)-dependent dehydrogenase (short-subunit alcohol dehydrogenase family)
MPHVIVKLWPGKSEQQKTRLAEKITKDVMDATFGRLDAAFTNADIQSHAMELADVPGEEFDRINGINLRGVWNCMKYEL